MDQKEQKNLLAVYNSIEPSRTRWIRNRNEMRNRWPELYEALETASGREPSKMEVYDEKWHMISNEGGIDCAVNRPQEAPAAKTSKK